MTFMRNLSSSIVALGFVLPLLFLSSVHVNAQSLLANRGLGFVVEPVDARGAALGGVTLGLPRGEMSWTNPADMAGLLAPGLQVVFQFDNFSADFDGRSATGSTARFPLIMGAFPLGERWVLSAGYGGFLDQNWSIEQIDTLVFAGDTVVVRDRFSSTGGIARLRLGASYSIAPPLSVGFALDTYTGLSQRELGRTFFPAQSPPCCRVEWRYSGFGGTAGAAWSPSEAINVSAAASFGGTLEARSDTLDLEGGSFNIPTMIRAGGSARVTPNTEVALATEWSGWGALNGGLETVGGSRDSWSVGGGLEWDGLQLRELPVPVRLGARYAALPFSWDRPGAPAAFPAERAVTGGIGLLLGGGAARSDLSVEIGRRGGGDAALSESYSRFVFSVTALGR
ncbi:hypothetical protein BH23GEM6_BH23GEM6_09560 [soil metagenome]